MEMTLKLLTFDKSEEQNLIEIYGKLDSRGIDRIISEKYVKALTDMGILNHIRSGFCIFNDILFKGYAGIRPPLFEGNTKDELLEESSFVWKVKGEVKALSEVSWNDLYTSYLFADCLVGTSVQLDQPVWRTKVFFKEKEEKPILYNSKGRPIKKSS